MHKYSGDLITPLKALQHAGQIEIITTSATHAVLPLLARPEAVRAQLAVAAEDYLDRFNRKPSGFWLPECAYEPRLNSYLKLSGFNYTFTESHAVEFAASRAPSGVYSPYRTPNGVGVFAQGRRQLARSLERQVRLPGRSGLPRILQGPRLRRGPGIPAPVPGRRRGAAPAGPEISPHNRRRHGPGRQAVLRPRPAMARVEAHASDFLARRMKQTDDFYAARGDAGR